MNRFDRDFEALQENLGQSVETVTRSSRVDIVGGGVDEIDPPRFLDQYAEQAKTNAIARANLRKFIHDVWEQGYRVEGPDETVAYFEGESDELDASTPEGTPDGGFLNQSSVFAGERHQDFYHFGQTATWQRWARGTVLVEYLKAESDNPESEITGFNFIRPETVYPQVQNNTNILLEPDFDDLPDDVGRGDVTFTKRDEVAAYIQFDDESILGLRNNGFDNDDVPLSQNDVLKQTLEPDIGGDIQTGEGVFGESAIKPVSEDIEEYEQTKRDLFEANRRKAYGVWTAQFTPEVVDLGDTQEVIEWPDSEIQNTEEDLIQMGPGDVLTSDANIDLESHDSDVPNLEWVLMQYVKDISSALPVPLPLAVDFAGDINRDVTSDQASTYEDLKSAERQYQETSWTQAIRFIADRKGLPTEGLKLKLEPPTEENPVKSLSTEEVDRMNTYVSTLSQAAGPQAGPTALVDREELLDVLDFPVDESTPQEEIQSITEEVSDEETEAAWNDIMNVDALQGQYEPGEWVSTPDGDAMVDDRVTEGTVDGMEASSDSPVYAVAMLDEAEVNFYRASDLEATDGPSVDVDDPTEDLEAMHNIEDAIDTGSEALQFGDFDYPDSWEEATTPARVILMDAWSSMGGQFDCGGACCKGTMAESGMTGRASDQFCASMKDAALGTHAWRGGWAD